MIYEFYKNNIVFSPLFPRRTGRFRASFSLTSYVNAFKAEATSFACVVTVGSYMGLAHLLNKLYGV
jgi:hypothetical protein